MKKVMCVLAAMIAAVVMAEESERSSDAIIRLLNLRTSGSVKSFEEAGRIVRADAEAGKMLQMFVIALVSEWPDPPEAAKMSPEQRKTFADESRGMIRRLAERNDNGFAWYLLSMENNDVKLLERAADRGNVQALNAYGTMLLDKVLKNPKLSTNEVEKSVLKAFDCFQQASLKKDPSAFYNLGVCYINGWGCETDTVNAFRAFKTSAEAGHPEAINNIGGFYRDGIIVAHDKVQAARWFKKSAELGNAYGLLNYALALKRGDGVERNAVEAVKLLETAAKSGMPEAINAYAAAIMEGDGTERDAKKAFALFLQAAEAGFPLAMDNVSNCYSTGVGTEEDSHKAVEWSVRARAARGDEAAAKYLERQKKEGGK